MRKQNDLGRDPIRPLVWRIAFPSMLAQFVSVLYSIVDRIYISNIPVTGETALAAKDVESWACSSLAASIAASGAVDETDELAVDLPPEYDAAIDHLRYEAADVVYHLLVVLERYGIGLDEFAAELNNRMTDAERPEGGVRLHEDHVKRGK